MSIARTSDRSRWLALYVLCVGMLMIVLDATIVNVALPTIQDDLGFSQNNLAWVVNAYLIAFGGLLLLAGRMGDLIGQRRIFLIGLTVFTSASLLCALAQDQAVLVAARFVQGVGGALTSAVILGMIVTMFPEPKDLAKAIGVYGFVASAGGVLTAAINWHWIFFVNLPVGVATGFFAVRLVENRDGIGLRKGADVPGAVLLTGGLMLGVYTILQVGEKGWASVQTVGLGAVALVLLAAFVLRQARIANPLMPLRLFKSRSVSGANVVQALLVAGMFGMFFLGALYLQQILGYDPLEVGLAFLPSTLAMGTMSLKLSGPLAMRYGPKNTLLASLVSIGLGLVLFSLTPVDASYATQVMPATILIGLGAGLAFLPATIVMGAMSLRFSGPIAARFGTQHTLVASLVFIGAGLVLFARTPVHGEYFADVMPAMILIGLGAGLGFPALMTLAMSDVTPEDSGIASGLVNTTVQVGGAVGLAVLATFAAERTDTLKAHGTAAAAALNSGYHLAYLIGAGLVAVAIAIVLAVLRPAAPAGAEAAAAAAGDEVIGVDPAYAD